MKKIPAASESLPRYRGFKGAVAFGFYVWCMTIAIGIAAGVVVMMFADAPGWAGQLLTGAARLGVVLGVSAALSRWLCGGTAERLRERRMSRGDMGLVGALVGILIAGMIAERSKGEERDTGRLIVGRTVKVAGPTLNGQPFDLSEYRGKVVIVDFWATWCVPCLRGLPQLREAYQRYHDQGLEVVGVSLDHERSQLEEFVQARKIPWKQIFFDEPESRGWDNPISRHYHIEGIPEMLLIDREGKLLEYGHEVEDLAVELKKALRGESARPEPGLKWLKTIASWLQSGALTTNFWLMLATGVGGALVFALLEMLVRRIGPSKATIAP